MHVHVTETFRNPMPPRPPRKTPLQHPNKPSPLPTSQKPATSPRPSPRRRAMGQNSKISLIESRFWGLIKPYKLLNRIHPLQICQGYFGLLRSYRVSQSHPESFVALHLSGNVSDPWFGTCSTADAAGAQAGAIASDTISEHALHASCASKSQMR